MWHKNRKQQTNTQLQKHPIDLYGYYRFCISGKSWKYSSSIARFQMSTCHKSQIGSITYLPASFNKICYLFFEFNPCVNVLTDTATITQCSIFERNMHQTMCYSTHGWFWIQEPPWNLNSNQWREHVVYKKWHNI